MKSKITLSILIVLGVLLYLNSDFYLTNRANKLKQEKLNELNSVERQIVTTGQYSFSYEERKQGHYTNDEFNQSIFIAGELVERTIKLSFQHDQLLIHYKYPWPQMETLLSAPPPTYKEVIEKIRFTDKRPYYVVEEPCKYCKKTSELSFEVLDWEVINPITGNVIEDVLKSYRQNNSDIRLNVSFYTDSPPHLEIIGGPNSFRTNTSYALQTLNHKYTQKIQPPQYEPYYYDTHFYKPWPSLIDRWKHWRDKRKN